MTRIALRDVARPALNPARRNERVKLQRLPSVPLNEGEPETSGPDGSMNRCASSPAHFGLP